MYLLLRSIKLCFSIGVSWHGSTTGTFSLCSPGKISFRPNVWFYGCKGIADGDIKCTKFFLAYVVTNELHPWIFFRLEPKKSRKLKSKFSSSSTIILGLFQPFIFQGCIVFSPPFRRLLLRAPVGLLWHPTRVSPGQSRWFCSPQTIPSRPWWVPPVTAKFKEVVFRGTKRFSWLF